MLVVIKGAGDLASGIALRLHHSKFDVVMTDLPVPLAVRRTVAFSEAIRLGSTEVEDVKAERAENTEEVRDCLARGVIPVLADPEAEIIKILKPEVVVDAILAKKNTGTTKNDAKMVIGVGPGFTAGKDCHAVIETKRGHTLGRVIRHGSAIPNTGVPGNVGGQTIRRLLKAPADGIFHPEKEIGDLVKEGDRVGNVDGVPVTKGMKSGDVDPRGATVDHLTVSDKATSIGGGVLEAILSYAGDRL